MANLKNQMIEDGKKLFALKNKKTKLSETLTELNKQIVEMETKLAEKMQDAECDKFNVKGQGTIYVQQKLYTNVLAENRDKLYAWLRANGCGDLVKDWVFPNTLTSLCKERIEAGKPMPDENIMTATFIPIAATRKGK
jgi:hypothetical protein